MACPLLFSWFITAVAASRGPAVPVPGPEGAAPTAAAAVTSAAPPTVPDIPYQRFVLDNGLEVIVVEDHRVPLVAVDVWVHVGSGDEEPGRTGFAHLFEHMMFQGAEHIGEDVHFDILRSLGATQVNGTTNSDRTNYFEVVPSHQLEAALWLESDRLGFLLPMLNERSLANQRDVVRNERRQRYDNVAYGKERFATHAALFPDGHPYRFLTIGRHEDIEKASVADVRAFWNRWYAPANATLALVGDVSVEQARMLTTKWFGPLRKAPRPPRTTRAPATLATDVRVDVDDGFARLPRLRWAWHGPRTLDDDDLDLGVLADILGAPGWGRLQRALVIEQAVAQSVTVMQNGQPLGGTFQIAVTLKPETDPAVVVRSVEAALAAVLEQGPTEAELSRSIRNAEADFLWGLEDLLTRAERLQFFGHTVGDVGYTGRYLQRLRTRTTTTVTTAAQQWLRRPRALIVTHPTAATTRASTATTPTPPGTTALSSTARSTNGPTKDAPTLPPAAAAAGPPHPGSGLLPQSPRPAGAVR
jgi:predicted Zn-dependent peptidase